jgi:hypothetical protein
MSWINPQGQRQTLGGQKAASDFLYEAYMMALAHQQPAEIRLAGHSLGSQMVSALAQRLSEGVAQKKIAARLLPDRVILLDPFFSNGAKAYLNGESNGDRVTRLARQYTGEGAMSLEIYRTSSVSFLPVADSHPALITLSAFRNIYTDGIFTVGQQGEKHNYAVAYYLWSFAESAPPYERGNATVSADFPKTGISAASPKADLLQFMKSELQIRSSDQATGTPLDDSCILERKGAI